MTGADMNNNENIKVGFLFDLDGVLIDSESIYTKIWSEINDLFPTGVENFAIKIKGTTLEAILGHYYPDPEVRAQVEEALYEREGKIVYQYTAGAKELLEGLKERDIPAVLVTSSNEIKMSHLWEHIPGMRDLFTAVITGDNVTKSKPDPEGYLLGAKLAGCAPNHCVVFEDSLQGVIAGRAAGAYVVGVAGTLPAEVIAPYSDVVVTTLEGFDIDKLVDILKTRK